VLIAQWGRQNGFLESESCHPAYNGLTSVTSDGGQFTWRQSRYYSPFPSFSASRCSVT
jgi:hypothetical protein